MKVIHSVVCLSLCLLLCSCAMQPHEAAKLYAVYAEEGEIDFDSAIWKAAPGSYADAPVIFPHSPGNFTFAPE